MAATGVKVKALDTDPELLAVDTFYYNMYTYCGSDLTKINTYCCLYHLSNDEILEAIEIMSLIRNEVK